MLSAKSHRVEDTSGVKSMTLSLIPDSLTQSVSEGILGKPKQATFGVR